MKTLQIQSRHKIRFIDATELACVTMGALGNRTMRAIAKETGLSLGQVGYRLRKAEISIKQIRNGKDPRNNFIQQLVYAKLRSKLASELQPKFR